MPNKVLVMSVQGKVCYVKGKLIPEAGGLTLKLR
jgi:hypothetical protein